MLVEWVSGMWEPFSKSNKSKLRHLLGDGRRKIWLLSAGGGSNIWISFYYSIQSVL